MELLASKHELNLLLLSIWQQRRPQLQNPAAPITLIQATGMYRGCYWPFQREAGWKGLRGASRLLLLQPRNPSRAGKVPRKILFLMMKAMNMLLVSQRAASENLYHQSWHRRHLLQ